MPAFSRVRSIAAVTVSVTAVLLASLFVSAPSASAMTRSERVMSGLTIAKAQAGDPYRYGAAGPDAFDCSGLIYYSFRRAGFNVPRTASAQAAAARHIAKGSLKVGDLVFFYNGAARAANVYHVGVFVGWDKGRRVILHAPHSGTTVHREAIWTSQWFAGTLR